MHIVFLAPGIFKFPCGGRKVICEYSNRFVRDGYKVTIIYPATDDFWMLNFRQKCRTLIAFIYYKITGDYTPRRWFNLNKNITQKYVWSLEQAYIPNADVYIATGVNTARFVKQFNIPTSKKFYFIQAFEDFVSGYNQQKIIETFHYDINKIVISSWLQKIIEDEGLKCVKAPNGFNFDQFKYLIDLKDRNKFSVCVYYSNNGEKGVKYSMESIEIVKRAYPQLKVNMFGLCPRPAHIPNWYNYIQDPSKEELNNLYNNSAIYIASSTIEGWGLTVGEAMICGCAVVCTNTTGFLEMANDRKNALVIPIKNPDAGADAIIKLITDDELRYRLAQNAMKSISHFNIENAYDLFKSYITNSYAKNK